MKPDAPSTRDNDDDDCDDCDDDYEDRAAILGRRALLVGAALAMPALAEAQSIGVGSRAPRPRPAHPRPCLEPPISGRGADPFEGTAAQFDPSRMTPDEIAAARATMPTARPPRVVLPRDPRPTVCLSVIARPAPRWRFAAGPRPSTPLASRRPALQRYGGTPRIVAAGVAPGVAAWRLELLESGHFRAVESPGAPRDLAESSAPHWVGDASDEEIAPVVRLADALWREPQPARVTPRRDTRELVYFVDGGDTFLLESDGAIEGAAARELLQRARAIVLRSRPAAP